METANTKQVITLTDQKVFSMGGVIDIAGFDEECVILDTTLGKITVEGREMKIESLTKDGGNILIKGEINGIYCAVTPTKKKGFFGRLV